MTTNHTHDCAATGCQKQIPLNLLMCMTHWRMVPAPLAREVLDAWRGLGRTCHDLTAVQAHREAAAKAIEAVHAKQFRKIATKTATEVGLFD